MSIGAPLPLQLPLPPQAPARPPAPVAPAPVMAPSGLVLAAPRPPAAPLAPPPPPAVPGLAARAPVAPPAFVPVRPPAAPAVAPIRPAVAPIAPGAAAVRPAAVAPGAVAPLVSAKGNFFQDFVQVLGQRIQDYLNLGHDLIQVVLHPATAFATISDLLTSGMGNGGDSSGGLLTILKTFAGLIVLILSGFVENRITPYVTSAKEGDWAKFSALVCVDVLDFVTFATLFKAVGMLKDAIHSGQGVKGLATGLRAAGAAKGASTLLPTGADLLNYSKYWAITNAVATTVVKNMGGVPQDQIYATYMAMKQNGLVLDSNAYSLFSQASFTDADRYTVFHHAVAMNQVNYVSGANWTWSPGRDMPALKSSVAPATIQAAEIDYLRFLPESRYQTLQKLCDLNGGYAFYQHAFATIPNAHRADFSVLMDDLYAYNQFMTGINPNYQLAQDPNQDTILTEASDAQTLALAAYRTSYPAVDAATAAAYVKQFWTNAMPVGERPMSVAARK